MTVQIWDRLTPEEKANVIRCLIELGFSVSDIARAAGVSPMAVSKWARGIATPTADKLEQLYLSVGPALEQCLPEPPISSLDVDMAVNVLAKALRSKTLRDYAAKKLAAILPGGLKLEAAYAVTKEDIEMFKAKALADGVSKETLQAYLRYLVRFLNHVGWTLTPENLQKVYTFDESDKAKREAIKALKRLIDTVIRAKDPQQATLLYDAFTSMPTRPRKIEKLPTLAEIKAVFAAAERISPMASALWGLLAEAGARFDHLFYASINGLELDRLRIVLNHINRTKRQPLVFLSQCAAQYLKDKFLPAREEYLRKEPRHRDRLWPMKENTMYTWLREARLAANLPWLEPHLLRKFFAQWMLNRGVDPHSIALLQGRALPGGVGVTIEYYIFDYESRLRKVWEENRPVVFEC